MQLPRPLLSWRGRCITNSAESLHDRSCLNTRLGRRLRIGRDFPAPENATRPELPETGGVYTTAPFEYTARPVAPRTHMSPRFAESSDPPRYLTQEQVAAVFRVIEDPRDLALFGLIYLYGLRVSEASCLRRRDVDLVQLRIVIRRAKGGIWGIRPLFASAQAFLVAYLGNAPPEVDPESPLFPGRNGPLSKRRIQELFTRFAHLAALPAGATCHSLRHAIATHLLDAGESLEFVKEHLGHRKIENTAIYARVSNPARDRAFARLERSEFIVRPEHPGPNHIRPRLPSATGVANGV